MCYQRINLYFDITPPNRTFWSWIFWYLPLVFLIFFYLPATKSCHQILFSFELALLLAAFQMPFYFLTRLYVDYKNWVLKNHVNTYSYSSCCFTIQMILLQSAWKCLNHLPGTGGQKLERPEAGTPGRRRRRRHGRKSRTFTRGEEKMGAGLVRHAGAGLPQL